MSNWDIIAVGLITSTAVSRIIRYYLKLFIGIGNIRIQTV